MEDKFIISSVLTNLTLKSKIEFIEAKDNDDLIKLAKSKGIDLPSPDLACFRAIYCELDVPNLNGAMLTSEAAKDGINSLVGKQINLNHQGKNYVIGYTIDAKIYKNLIIVTGILFKSLFFEEFDEIKELFEEGKLFLSFELWNKEPETGNSIIEETANGIKKITKMIAHGVGLLLKGVKPACKRAQVFKLLANQKDNGEQIFQEDDRFAYASFSNEIIECTHCGKCKKEEPKLAELYELLVAEIPLEITEEEIASFENDEGEEVEEAKKLTYEERQKLSDDDFAVVVTVKNKVTGEPRKIRMFPIYDKAHVRNALARLAQEKVKETLKKLGVSIESVEKKILKKAKELNMTDLLERHEKSQVTPEPAQVVPLIEVKPEPAQVAETPVEAPKVIKTVREESYITTEIPKEDGSGYITERKGHTKSTTYYSNGKESVSEEDFEVVDKYTFAQMEEKINETIDVLIAALPEEVTTCVKGKIKDGLKPADAIKECWKEYKDKQSKAMADIAGEKETEITNLKIELGKKDQEIAELKTPKVIVAEVKEKDKDLNVGSVEHKEAIKGIQEDVNKKAFPQKKTKR